MPNSITLGRFDNSAALGSTLRYGRDVDDEGEEKSEEGGELHCGGGMEKLGGSMALAELTTGWGVPQTEMSLDELALWVD